MYRYAADGTTVVRIADGAFLGHGNSDHRDAMEWAAAGNTIAPYTGDVAAEKRVFLARLDDDAERLRLRYVTPGAGMAMIYQEKFAQAQAVSAMGETAANAMTQADREAQFPTLSASVGLEGATLWSCCQLVLQKYTQFAALSLHIERARLTGKARISQASTVDGVRTAYGAVAWPTP